MFQITNQVSYPLVIHGKGHHSRLSHSNLWKILVFAPTLTSLIGGGISKCWNPKASWGSTTRLHGQIPLLVRPKRATKGARIFELVKFIQIPTCPAKIPCSVSTIPTIPIKWTKISWYQTTLPIIPLLKYDYGQKEVPKNWCFFLPTASVVPWVLDFDLFINMVWR